MSFRQDELTGHNWPSGSVSVGIPVRPPALEKIMNLLVMKEYVLNFKLQNILIILAHRSRGLPSILFHSGFPATISNKFIVFHDCATFSKIPSS